MLRLVYRLVLRACPRDIRHDRGREMEEVFLFCVTARGAAGGVLSRAGAIARGIADAVAFAWSARWGAARNAVGRTDHERSGRRRWRRPVVKRQDVVSTIRFMRRQPILAGAIVLMLALGLGTTTALFSVVYGVLLDPLPFPDANRLVEIAGSRPDKGWDRVSLTEANFWDLADLNRTFSGMGAWHGAVVVLTDGTEPERVDGAFVTSGFFRALGVQPVVGRLFSPDDDRAGAEGAGRPVLLSQGLWMRRYGGDRGIVGRPIAFSSGPRTVVGVLPAGTPWLDAAQVFVPLVRRADADRGSFEYAAVGRLKPGVTPSVALADLQTVSKTLERRYPATNAGLGVVLESSRRWIASDDLRRTLWILLGSVGLLLVIACVNVTNLLLARASARAQECAVRVALGASRLDLLREWLVESVVLSGVSMLVGLVIAEGLLRTARAFSPAGIPRLADVALNGWAFGVACTLALVVGLATGLVPALETQHTRVVGRLGDSPRGSVGTRRQDRLRQGFVAAEVAFSLILLVGAGLLVRSLAQVLAADRGFATDHRLLATVTIPGSYGQARINQLDRDLVARVRAMPQVLAAAFVSAQPLANGSTGLGFAAGDRPDDGAAVPWASWRFITPDYFKTMGVPVVAGRTFTADEPEKPMRTIISRRVADLLWPGENAIGRAIVLWKGQGDRRAEVVGVVGNMRERGLENNPTLAIYLPVGQSDAWGSLNLVIRTKTDPLAIAPDLRTTIASVDRHLPVSDVHQFDDAVSTSVATRRFTMLLLAAFAAMALVLALAGVGGVLAYAVAKRTREIGLRLALGAEPRGLVRFVLARGMQPVIVGWLIGLAAAFWLSRLMASLLFGITPSDPATYAIVSLGLIVTTVVACYLPARRVLLVDPAVSLRAE
jgi:predicted permease